jgi:hypothetical protein
MRFGYLQGIKRGALLHEYAIATVGLRRGEDGENLEICPKCSVRKALGVRYETVCRKRYEA